MTIPAITKDMQEQLAKPFDESEVKWKPQVTTRGKNKEDIIRNGVRVAGCTAHIDARSVMNRLDEVVGVGGWSDSYNVLSNGKNVECTLTVLGVSKSDVGEPNTGGNADQMKGAYSDALKRAAVKFGIGRHLYDMEMEWLPFDGYKITQTPTAKSPQPVKPQQKAQPQSDDAFKQWYFELPDGAKSAYVAHDTNDFIEAISYIERYGDNPNAAKNAVEKFVSLDQIDFTPKDREAARIRVMYWKRVNAYAKMRNAGMESARAVSGALAQVPSVE